MIKAFLKKPVQFRWSIAGKKYLKNVIWMFSEQILRLVSGFFVGLWIARSLGPSDFGIYSYVFAFTALFSGVTKLGLDGIMVRELIYNKDANALYLGTAFWLKVLSSLASFLVIVVISLLLPYDNVIKMSIIIVASGFVFQGFEVIDFHFQSLIRTKVVSVCKILQLIISSSLKIYFVLMGAGLTTFIIISVIDQMILAISLIVAYYKAKGDRFYFNFNINIAKKLFKDSWPLIFSNIVIVIYMRVDQLMIKEMLDDREVGIYSAAVRISEMWYFVPILICNALFPAILNSKKIDEELYQNRLRLLYVFLFWLAVLIAIPMTFFSGHIIVFLYGASYLSAGDVLATHIWTGVFVFIGVAFSNYLIAENLTKISVLRTAIGAISNILLNLLLIPIWGIIGSAIATLIAQSVSNFFYDFFDKKVAGQLKLKIYAVSYPFYGLSKILLTKKNNT